MEAYMEALQNKSKDTIIIISNLQIIFLFRVLIIFSKNNNN